MFFVKKSQELVDVRVEYGFANQAQRTVSDLHGFSKPFGSNSRHTFQHLDLFIVALFDSMEDHFR